MVFILFFANRSFNGTTSSCTNVGTSYEYDSIVPVKANVSHISGETNYISFSEILKLKMASLGTGSTETITIFKDSCDPSKEISSFQVSNSDILVGEKQIDVDVSSVLVPDQWLWIYAQTSDEAGNIGECSDRLYFFMIDDKVPPTDNTSPGESEAYLSYTINKPTGSALKINYYPESSDCSSTFSEFNYSPWRFYNSIFFYRYKELFPADDKWNRGWDVSSVQS